MGKDMRFLESDSTPEEDSYTWSIEWDRILDLNSDEYSGNGQKIYDTLDSAWDAYHYFKKKQSKIYFGLKLYRIAKDGIKKLWEGKE